MYFNGHIWRRTRRDGAVHSRLDGQWCVSSRNLYNLSDEHISTKKRRACSRLDGQWRVSLRNLYNLSDEHISTKKRQSISQSVNQSQITVFIMLIKQAMNDGVRDGTAPCTVDSTDNDAWVREIYIICRTNIFLRKSAVHAVDLTDNDAWVCGIYIICRTNIFLRKSVSRSVSQSISHRSPCLLC